MLVGEEKMCLGAEGIFCFQQCSEGACLTVFSFKGSDAEIPALSTKYPPLLSASSYRTSQSQPSEVDIVTRLLSLLPSFPFLFSTASSTMNVDVPLSGPWWLGRIDIDTLHVWASSGLLYMVTDIVLTHDNNEAVSFCHVRLGATDNPMVIGLYRVYI